MMIHFYLNPADLFWLVTAVAWITFSVIMLHTYTAARQAALQGRNRISDPDTRTLARAILNDFMRAEAFRLAGHIVAVVIGLAAATIPPDSSHALHVTDIVISVGLILINCVQGANSVNAYLSWVHRERLYERLRKP